MKKKSISIFAFSSLSEPWTELASICLLYTSDAADEGTIRKAYAESIEANSVHGSDSDENAKIEIDFFFKPEEIVG